VRSGFTATATAAPGWSASPIRRGPPRRIPSGNVAMLFFLSGLHGTEEVLNFVAAEGHRGRSGPTGAQQRDRGAGREGRRAPEVPLMWTGNSPSSTPSKSS
jgi:hypothetical protein